MCCEEATGLLTFLKILAWLARYWYKLIAPEDKPLKMLMNVWLMVNAVLCE